MTPSTSPNTPTLVADVGGTNARFALAHMTPAAKGEQAHVVLSHIKVLPTKDYDSLQAAAAAYLKDTPKSKPTVAALAVAGPLTADFFEMTNCPWSFRQSILADELGMEKVVVLNDFEAIACALPHLNTEDLHQVGPGEIRNQGNKVVLGPGTGIGVAALTPVLDGWKPLTSEAGHIGFAPETDIEHEISKLVQRKYPRVSIERLVSGQGISTLHGALSAILGQTPEALSAEEITRRALKDREGICGQTTDIFCNILGSFAGDLAVSFNAIGGVYLAGGILPKIESFFLNSKFRTRFENKGRLSYVKDIPTLMIQEKLPALIGAAAKINGHFY
ncbi:MAG: glucokinase [Kordiimonadaceae bacterium]|nr:glucokinase [Kordiimonadaceae bacterium]